MNGKGGTETVIKNLYHYYDNNDLTLNLYLLGGSNNYEWLKDIDYREKKLSKNRILRNLQYILVLPLILFNYIKNSNPDIILSTNPVIWAICKIICQNFYKDTKIVSWYHYSLSQKKVNSFLLKKADYYMAISSGIQEQLISKGIDNSRIKLVYNPILFSKQKILKTVGTPKLIYMGRAALSGQKNLKELLDALYLVVGDWELDVYGTSPTIDECIEYAKKMGIDNNITWKGFVENPWGDIHNADALVLTSKYEGLPMVLGEAISRNLYAISSNCSTGPVDIVKPGINGALYELGDVQSLTKELQKVIDRIEKKSENLEQTIDFLEGSNYYKNVVNILKLWADKDEN